MATTFTKEDCSDIMAPMLKAALPLSGVQSRMPRDLLHGPVKPQGMSLPAAHATQLIQHLQAILRHGTRPTLVGGPLRCVMDELVLLLGSAKPFWELVYDDWKCLCPEDDWLVSTWRDLQSTELEIKGPLNLIKPQRLNDVHLMDAFMAQDYSDDKIQTLNACRLFLKVTTLSDIVTAEGKRIVQAAVSGRPLDRTTQYNCPRSRRPPASAWQTWSDCLQETFGHKLRTPLGIWLLHEDPSWNWWYSAWDNRLYHREGQSWVY